MADVGPRRMLGPSGGPWIAFPYNGALDYADFGGAHQVVQYRMTILGQVEIRGTATKPTTGSAGQTMGTLPAGYRPAATWCGLISGSGTAYEINVTSAGAVIVQQAVVASTRLGMNLIRFWPT